MFRAEEDVLSGGPDINEPFVTLEPGADGNYQVTEDPSDGFDRPAADAAGRSENRNVPSTDEVVSLAELVSRFLASIFASAIAAPVES